MCVLEVVAPQRPDLVLAAHVPHSEADVLVFHGFHVEAWRRPSVRLSPGLPLPPSLPRPSLLTYSGNGGHDFTQLQFVQDGGLSRSI